MIQEEEKPGLPEELIGKSMEEIEEKTKDYEVLPEAKIYDAEELSLDDLQELSTEIPLEGDQVNAFFDVFAAHKERVKKISELEKEAKAAMVIAEKDLISAMKDINVDSMRIKGKNVAWKDVDSVSVKAPDREAQFEWLRSIQAGHLIKETVNARTFQSFFNTELAIKDKDGNFTYKDDKGEIRDKPEFIQVFTQPRISLTKAR